MNYEIEKLKERLTKLDNKINMSLDSGYAQKVESMRYELVSLINVLAATLKEEAETEHFNMLKKIRIMERIEAFDKKYSQYF